MMETDGLDALIAWSLFFALLVVLGFFLTRPSKDLANELRSGKRDDGESQRRKPSEGGR